MMQIESVNQAIGSARMVCAAYLTSVLKNSVDNAIEFSEDAMVLVSVERIPDFNISSYKPLRIFLYDDNGTPSDIAVLQSMDMETGEVVEYYVTYLSANELMDVCEMIHSIVTEDGTNDYPETVTDFVTIEDTEYELVNED